MSNAVIDCLLNHRSVRRFKHQPLEPETLDLLLQAGVRAPSAGNLQQYSLIVVDDAQKKRAVWDSPLVDGPTMIVSVVDEYRLKRWFELNGAPFYFDQAINLLIGYWDAIIALHNVVVAAEGLGLGAVYVGMILSADLAGALGTPEYVFPAGMALVGYPDESPDLRPRLPLEAVVHRNGYQVPTDAEMRAFFRERDQGWEGLQKELRQRFEERGIRNSAQRVTLGHYTREFIGGESEAVLRNLKRSGFRLGDGE
jgi:nitroreductase